MTYTGLCIGGRLDGEMITRHIPILKAHKLPQSIMPEFLSDTSPEPDMDAKFEVVTYFFVSSIHHHNDNSLRLGFWLLEGATILDALSALMKRYEEPRKFLPLLERCELLIADLLHSSNAGYEIFSRARSLLNEIAEIRAEPDE